MKSINRNAASMVKSFTWFKVSHNNVRGMVLGKEIIRPAGLDFPLDLSGKLLILMQQDNSPIVCKLIGVNELTQQLKVELLLDFEKTKLLINAASILRTFEIIWYDSGKSSISKLSQNRIGKVLSENNIKFLNS